MCPIFHNQLVQDLMVLSVILISQHFPFSSLLKPTRHAQKAFDLFGLFGLVKSLPSSDYLLFKYNNPIQCF